MSVLEAHQLSIDDIDVVALHGQTVLHRPEKGITLQLGNGLQLSNQLKIPVVDDFRSKDMEAGGQGAPLVPIYHQALVQAADLEVSVAVLNVGGVANVTYVGSNGELIAFDTGPGNALINGLGGTSWCGKYGCGGPDCLSRRCNRKCFIAIAGQ